jgi:hypothetical protein
MATSAQIAANRRNAQHSTGPRTEEGKAAVRLNSLTHGLRAEDSLLPGEDEQAFEDLRQAFHQQHDPQGPAELFCVEKMLLSFWRNRRIAKIETDLYMQFYPSKPEQSKNMDGVLGRSFAIDSLGQDNFCRLARYESSIDRAFYRASKELQALQKARIGFARQNENPPPPAAIQPAPPTPLQVTTEPIRSESVSDRSVEPPKRYRQEPNGKLIELTHAPPCR